MQLFTFTDELSKEYGTLYYAMAAPRTLNRGRQVNLCSRYFSSTTWRFSTKIGLETWARKERRKGCVVLNVFAEAKDMAGETGYYKDQCLLQKLAGAQKR